MNRPIFAELEPFVGIQREGFTISLVSRAVRVAKLTFVVALEHEVDNPCERIRTLLRRGPIAQNLNPFNRARRNRVHVYTRRASTDRSIDVNQRTPVPPLIEEFEKLNDGANVCNTRPTSVCPVFRISSSLMTSTGTGESSRLRSGTRVPNGDNLFKLDRGFLFFLCGE